eukprot:6477115-Alexandrium_andersonii.AAC.1
MSASLVGSEMCIRDRPTGRTAAAHTDTALSTARPCRRPTKTRQGQELGPTGGARDTARE